MLYTYVYQSAKKVATKRWCFQYGGLSPWCLVACKFLKDGAGGISRHLGLSTWLHQSNLLWLGGDLAQEMLGIVFTTSVSIWNAARHEVSFVSKTVPEAILKPRIYCFTQKKNLTTCIKANMPPSATHSPPQLPAYFINRARWDWPRRPKFQN